MYNDKFRGISQKVEEKCIVTDMKVLIVEGMDPFSPKIGGGEVYSQNLLEYLSLNNVETTLLGVSYSNRHIIRNNVDFIPVAQKSTMSGYEFFLRLLAKVPFMFLPTSIIIHAQRPEYIFPFILFHRENPKVVTLHGQILESVKLKYKKIVMIIYKKIEAFSLKHCDLIIAVEESIKDYYQQLYPQLRGKIEVIPVGINLNKFKPLNKFAMRQNHGFNAEDKIILYVGRLEKEKRLPLAIESFFIVRKSIPKAKLVLVGEGKERSYLESLVRRLDLEDVIIFMGAQKPEKIPEIMNCADVIVLCSLFEGSPTVVREALACGIPVVSTDVGDVSRIIRNDATGRIVSRDKKEFAQAIVEMLLNEDKKRVRIECAKVAANFSFNQVGMRTVELYKELQVEKGFELGRRPGRTRVD